MGYKWIYICALGIGNLNIKPLSICKLQENWQRRGHTVVMGINKLTFTQYQYNSWQLPLTPCCSAYISHTGEVLQNFVSTIRAAMVITSMARLQLLHFPKTYCYFLIWKNKSGYRLRKKNDWCCKMILQGMRHPINYAFLYRQHLGTRIN
jgi:hypothetical protein